MKTLVIQCPGTVSGSGSRKLENYVGIEFVRGASDGGGDNGYYGMIGDEDLLETMPLFNSIKLATVTDGTASSSVKGWTASDTDGDVMQVFPTMYAILGGTNATYERWIFSDSEFTYDGDTAVEIPSWGECPDWQCYINSVPRSIMGGGTTSYGTVNAHVYADSGLTTSLSEFTGTGYPQFGVHRFNIEEYARRKNDNTSSNEPYSNANCFDLEVVMGMLYVECRTKNITSIFGHGLSSNATPTASTWGKTVSGFRITNSDGSYTYKTMNDSAKVYLAGTSTVLRTAVGINYACTKVLEVQNSIYTGDGEWTLNSVTNSDGDALYDTTGGTGIAIKTISFYLSNYSASSDDSTGDTVLCELALCVPMWRWRTNIYGNALTWISGYEVVNYADADGTVHNDLYRAPSIKAISTDYISTSDSYDPMVYQSDPDGFSFTSTYDYVGDLGKVSGWCSENLSVDGRILATAVRGENGSSAGINNYESAYNFVNTTEKIEGMYIRVGVSAGGFSASNASLRYMYIRDLPNNSSYYYGIGGHFRVALE